jgi:hypothetical protein
MWHNDGEGGMSIANEIRALHQRMVENNQRDIDVMTEVANVFLRIDEARQRGYAQLARAFSERATAPAQPLQETKANGQVQSYGGAMAGLSPPPPLPEQPYMTQEEADAYMRATEATYPIDQYSPPADIARRFGPPTNGQGTYRT